MKHILVLVACLCALPLLCAAFTGADAHVTGVKCTNSGDEYGNVYVAEISRAEDGRLTLTVTESAGFDQPETVTVYTAPEDTLERIGKIVKEFNMTEWAARPDYLDVCDASHPYLVLEVTGSDGKTTSYSISGYIDFTDKEEEAYDAVWAIVHEAEDLTEASGTDE